MKKRAVLLPNVVTASSLACGLFVIFKMTMIPPQAVTYQNVLGCVLLLILAAFLDVLDGAIARVIKAESEFGGVFDCLADAISFGVAPAVAVLKTLSVEPKTALSYIITTAAILHSVCGVLRLVRFRVISTQVQQDTDSQLQAKKYFTGLPIPASAMALISTMLFLMSNENEQWFYLPNNEKVLWMAGCFFILGYLMVSRWKFPSVKTLQFRISSFIWVLITICLIALLLMLAVNQFAVMLFVSIWSYIFIAWSLSILRLLSGRRIQALEEFEPADEEE